jgi:hypothetical protein
MANTADLKNLEARLDHDMEREGGYRTPVRVTLDRRGTLRTLIEKRADTSKAGGR